MFDSFDTLDRLRADKLRASGGNGRRHRRGMHLDKRQRWRSPPNCRAVATPDLPPPKVESGLLQRFTLAIRTHGQAAASLMRETLPPIGFFLRIATTPPNGRNVWFAHSHIVLRPAKSL